MAGLMAAVAFWSTTRLADLSREQWESLCDGCARCCMHKVEDEDSGEVFFTRAACKLLACDTCRCTDYPRRNTLVPQCLQLSAENLATLSAWLPSSCAYRLLDEGKPLPDWHPLISGNADSVHVAGISVRYLAIPEDQAGDPVMQIIPDLDQSYSPA